MARRGRQGDEIKNLVEVVAATAALTMDVSAALYFIPHLDTTVISTHNAVAVLTPPKGIAFTAPRSAYYKTTVATEVTVSYGGVGPLGQQTILQMMIYLDPSGTPTFRDYLSPTGSTFKHTPALTADASGYPVTATNILFLSAGTQITIAARVPFLDVGDSVILSNTRVSFELLTDSRRLGSY